MANMRELDPGASPLDFYGAELRRLREAAGFTLKELGSKVFCTGSLIGQIETARKIPTPEFTQRVDEVLGGGGLLVRLLDLVYRHEVPLEIGAYADLERKATHIYAFEPLVVHGLLQTEAYAREILSVITRKAIDERLTQRLERQQILSQDPPPLVWMVLWEPVLYQVVGGPEVMRKQLAHLLELSRQERVRIQVLPFTAGAHTGTKGAFTMFRSPGEPDVCYTENMRRERPTSTHLLYVMVGFVTLTSRRLRCRWRAASHSSIA